MSKVNSDKNIGYNYLIENLKFLRLKHNLTPADIGRVIGKTRQAYVHYENGNRDIGIKDLIKLSDFYNISIDTMVGNPHENKNNKTIAFRSFENSTDRLVEIMPLVVSTINDDVICYKENDEHISFFWKTNQNQENRIMIFDYYDKTFVSKIYYKSSGGGHFYINDKPKYFNKANAENIVFKGVLMGELNKHIDIPYFFK